MWKISGPVMRMIFYVQSLLMVPAVSAYGQIGSSGHSAVEETEYTIEFPGVSVKDSIYIYCSAGSLSASYPGAGGELKFEWSVYDPALPGFAEVLAVEYGTESHIEDAESGGYQVKVSGGSISDTTFRAWVFVNNPSVGVSVARHDCQVIDLSGSVNTETFTYYDPGSNDPYDLPSGYEFSWTADPFVAVSSSRLDPRIWDPPPVVTDYTLTVSYYSCEVSSTLAEDPVTTRAGFTIDPQEGEAPLEVSFDAGESLNAERYEWHFDFQPDNPGPVTPDDFTENPGHIYYIPGEYYVSLKTVSGLCEDVFSDPEPVKVYPSELEVSNVFTPDGDGYNDMFLVRAVSLRSFRAVISDRNGRKVVELTDPSAGWDGKTSGGSLAAPGVYYYVITGTGWDEKEYEFKGPLYLYRSR